MDWSYLGRLDVSPPRTLKSPVACVVDGCDRPRLSRGWCKRHYTRWIRHGDPTVVLPRTAPRRSTKGRLRRAWKPEVTYIGAHARVRRVRGRAAERLCSCGSPARDWAYLHNDPNERTEAGRLYSQDPFRYEAMCRPCHRTFDLVVEAGGSPDSVSLPV